MSQIAIASDLSFGAARGERQRSRTFLWRAVREPFLHFILLGVALFAINEYLEQRAKFTRIVITPQLIRGIAENYRLQYGVTPTGKQLDRLVDEYIREEVFYHEALKLGLDRDDEIIRRRLVQKYEFLQQDLALAGTPSETQLRRYYLEHQAAYRTPDRVSFTQVYFSIDGRDEDSAYSDAQHLAALLNAQGVTRAAAEGDRFAGPTDFADASGSELARVFGKEGLATAVFGVEPNQWVGPLRSGFGWHLVFVSARRPGALSTFEEARDTVRRDYLEALRSARNADVYSQLKRDFVIVRE